MSFTLTDPRMQAISGAASNFGSGLSDQLVKYIEARQFEKAMQGVNENTNVLDVLKNFQTNRVPQHLQEQFLSQQVQSRLAQQRASNAFNEFGNMSEEEYNNLSTPQLVAKLQGAFANVAGGQDASASLINTLLGRRRTNNLGKAFGKTGNRNQQSSSTEPIEPTQEKGDPRKPEVNITNVLPTRAEMQAEEQGMQQPNPPRGQTGGRIPYAPFTTPQAQAQSIRQNESTTEPSAGVNVRPMRATDVASLISSLASENPDMNYEDIVEAAKIQSGANENEFNAGIKVYEQQEKQRQARQAEEDRIDKAVEEKIDKHFPGSEQGPGIDPHYETMLKQLTRYYPGTSTDARYTKARKTVTDLLHREQNLLDYEGRPLFGAWRPGATKQHLDHLTTLARPIWNDPNIPEFQRPQQIDRVRSLLASRGIEGPVEQEYVINKMINPDFKKDVAKINRLPSAPEEAKIRVGTGKFGVMAPSKRDEEKNSQQSKRDLDKIANFLTETAGGYVSPLMVRSGLLSKKWSEEQIREAYDLAQENGANFSDYQRNQISQLSKDQKPSLRSIFTGLTNDKSEQGIWDVFISGRE